MNTLYKYCGIVEHSYADYILFPKPVFIDYLNHLFYFPNVQVGAKG